jgi:hypothetical protein
MTRLKQTILGATLIAATGFGLAAQAGSKSDDAAEVQHFMASSQNLTQAIAAAEKAIGGKAMEAGWEGKTATAGAFEVTIAKADGTLSKALIAADGTVQVTAMVDDNDQDGDKSDEKGAETDADQDGDKG